MEIKIEVPQQVAVQEAIRQLCWSMMHYRCEECGFETQVYLMLGVEGPKVLRDQNYYVPAPFTVACPAWPIKPDATALERAQFRHLQPCSGTMAHVQFNLDRDFAPRMVEPNMPRFALDMDFSCARLVWTEAALIKAWQYHHDKSQQKQYKR